MSDDRPSPSAELHLSIIALDDDADFREFIKHTLASEGHEIRVAGTPAELFALIELKMPEIVLLDMKMGRDRGEEVLEELRKRWPKLCVIVITGYPSMDSMRELFKKDAFDYLSKPFSIEELRKSIAQAAKTFGFGQSTQDRLRHEVGRQIRLARSSKDWTLKDLSEAAGLSVSQLSSIERGSHLPSLESLIAIAGALDQKASQWLLSAGL